MNKTTAAVGVIALLAGIAIGATVTKATESSASSQTASTKKAMTTAKVERRTLEVTETTTGELLSSSETAVTTLGTGTITQAATLGATVSAGSVLARVNDQPVVVLSGSEPVWRAFAPDMTDGPDIRQLELNLVALGFDPDGMTVDATYSSATEAAITAWEESLGIDSPDGTVPLGEAIFASLPAQVAENVAAGTKLSAGDTVATLRPVGGAGLHLEFTVTEEADRYQPGQPVTILTNDDVQHPATITALERVASSGGLGGGGGNSSSFTVSANPTNGDGLAAGPVSVLIPTELAKDVVAVPSRALVAVVEGGQAVQLADGDRLVAVKVGVFADGWVEVTGDEIHEGDEVVVPS